jgi:hypothetical protein
MLDHRLASKSERRYLIGGCRVPNRTRRVANDTMRTERGRTDGNESVGGKEWSVRAFLAGCGAALGRPPLRDGRRGGRERRRRRAYVAQVAREVLGPVKSLVSMYERDGTNAAIRRLPRYTGMLHSPGGATSHGTP